MPYKDKELKSKYQERQATPYMKKWREDNREHHRKYIREWARKRRQDKAKSKSDYEKSKTAPSFESNRYATNGYNRGQIVSMSDYYITYCLTKRGVISKEVVNKELISIHRKFLIIKRKLKQL